VLVGPKVVVELYIMGIEGGPIGLELDGFYVMAVVGIKWVILGVPGRYL
jgi:hypothetical protein